jgi:hypothetical protein
MDKPKYITESETHRLVSIFDSFKKDAEDTENLTQENVEATSNGVLSMSSLGKFGRFGN